MGRRVAALGAAASAVLVVVIGCGGPAKEGGEGAECFRAEECVAGLVCLEKVELGGRFCTSDLTSVNFRSDAGMGTDTGGGPGN